MGGKAVKRGMRVVSNSAQEVTQNQGNNRCIFHFKKVMQNKHAN